MSQAPENSEPIVKLENFIKISNVAWKFLQIDLFKVSSGIKRISTWKEKFKKSLKKMFFWFNIIVLSSYSINRILACIPFNIEKFSFHISVFAAIFLAVVKYCNIIWNQARISCILKLMPENYTKDDCAKHEIQRTYDKFHRFIKIYSTYLCFPVLHMFLGPLMENLATGERTFPFLMTFSFDATSSLAVYLVAYAYCVHVDIVSRTVILSNDNILCGLVVVISLEFEILRAKLSELKLMSEKDAKVQLKELIKRHQQLIFCAQEIQEIFSISFSLNFIMSSFFTCFTGFHLSTTADFSAAAIDMVFCVFSLMNIFMQCYTGQMLRDAGDGVVDGIFDCDWEMMKDVQMRKDLLFVMKRAQKGIQFMIMQNWPVDIEQFGSVSYQFCLR
jgi:hypothetical protein